MARKSKGFGRFIKIIGILFGIWFVISWIYSAIDDFEFEIDDYEYVDYDEDGSQDFDEDYERPLLEDHFVDTFPDDFYVHDHEWKDNKQNSYKGKFKVKKGYKDVSTEYREDLNSNFSYAKVYRKLAQFDADKLDELIAMFEKIKDDKRLSSKEFADMVVTSIQNIPYVLVHDYTHEQADLKWGGFIEEYHRTGDPCLEEIKFGLQSPVEFMANFLGDCDTRAVLCYLILKDFGFDVAVLGSDTYGHAVLGISGNYRGSFVKKDGIKFYAWETTATGYRPGVMAPDWSNMDYWTVDIASTD